MLHTDPVQSVEEIGQRLRIDGFMWIAAALTDAEFVALGHDLGEIVDDTPVRVVPGKRTYLARPDPIPLHTDHPKTDLIAWRCESQDARDGASLLVDGYRVVQKLQAQELEGLEILHLPAMVRLGGDATPTPILTRAAGPPRLFYAPWLEPIGRPLEVHGALVAFRRALAREQVNARAIRLEPGQVLIVDNHRMLHGRDGLLPDSTRRLRRLWVRAEGHDSDLLSSPIET